MVWQFIINRVNAVSTLQLDEYIKIIATWYHDTNLKQYDCKNQIEQMKRRNDSQNRIEGHKNRNGCGRVTVIPKQIHGIVRFHNCYCDHLLPNFDHFLFLHEHYSKGQLPHPGSISDQPNKVIEIMKVIDRLKLEREIALQKEQAKAKKNVR